jgi:hypothetical protein
LKRALPLFLLAGAVAAGFAQQLPSADVDLFGDAIVKPVEMGGRGRVQILPAKPAKPVEPPAVKPEAPGYAHGLVFHDGRMLRGELVAVTKTEVIWKRPDADVPMRFARDEVRRLVLRSTPTTVAAMRNVIVMGRLAAAPDEDPTPAPVTMKLGGGDWLHGDLRSVDGKEFTLQLASGLNLKIARDALDWLYFSKRPVPASGFAGDPLSLESWMLGNPAGGLDVDKGVLSVTNGNWIGRSFSPPKRFEVELSIPKGDTQNSRRLWLQPFGNPSPNSYTTGTVVLTLSATQFGHQVFLNQFDEKTMTVPKDDVDGPTRYRVFYDGVDNKMAVFRNGKPLADWKLIPDDKDFIGPPNPNMPQAVDMVRQIQRPTSLCVDSGGSGSFKLQGIRIQPWDGVLPKADEAERKQDLLSTDKDGARPGVLEALSEKEITFSGQTLPRAAGTFIRMAPPAAPAPAPLAAGDALLIFGAQGELSAGDLEIAEGRVKCRTSLGPDAELPLDRLEVIAFSRRKAPALVPADVLVFRNGDTLRGTLLGAGKDERLRWRSGGGQELALDTARLAGVRLNSKAEVKPAEGATVEMRNGDRYRGEMLLFDGKGVRLKHALLGDLMLEQPKLWNVLLNPKLVMIDGGADPTGLIGLRMQGVRLGNNQNAPTTERVFLDGHFLQFGQPGNNYSSQEYFSHSFKDIPDRYEIRAEATDSGGAEPYLTISLTGNGGMPSVQASVAYGQLRIYGYNLNNNAQGNGRRLNGQVNRSVPLENKLPESNSRRSLRLFVDTKLGTVDFFVNGVHITKFGQSPGERAPGVGAQFNVYAYVQSGNAVVLSNLWVGPWNGEIPRPGEDVGAVYLNNGDFAAGSPKGIKDGKLTIEGELGPLSVPLERITNVQFGGEATTEKAVARLRLRDGAIVHLDNFHWDGTELKAHSTVLGDLKVPVEQVMELILAPSAIRFPKAVEARKIGEKEAGAGDVPEMQGLQFF